MSVVVRELVTRLGFRVDNQGLNRFENSIRGFQNRFVITSDSIARAVDKVITMTTEFANSAISAENLARFTGQSFEQIKSMQLALSKFNLDEKTTENLFSNIAIGVKEASRGVNNFVLELAKVAPKFIQIRKENGQLFNVEDFIKGLGQAIKMEKDLSERSRIISNIPGLSSMQAADLLKFLEQSNDEIERLIKAEVPSALQIKDSLDDWKDFRKEIAEVNTEFTKLTATVGKATVPVINKFLMGANEFLEALSVDVARINAHGTPNGRAEFLKNNPGKRYEYGNEMTPLLRAASQAPAGFSTIQVTNDNRFEIIVPPGTTGDQANAIAESMRIIWDNLWNEKVREVINNSPTVE